MSMKRLISKRGSFLFLFLAVSFLMPCGLFPQPLQPLVNIPDRERCAATEESSPFALDYYTDIGLAAGALGLTVTGRVMEHNVHGWNGRDWYDKDNINFFDKIWYNEYRPAVDDLGTIAVFANVLGLPLGIYATEAIAQNLPPLEFANVGVMLAESYFIGYGLRNIIKTSIRRTRPYMYTGKWDWDSVRDGDYTLSFPSGHTTDAFMGAAFLSYTFCKYYPESRYRIPVVVTTYALAVTTGLLRIASGNHFMTDVATGAALGTAIGLLVPFVHGKVANFKYRGRRVLAFDGQTLTATLRF
jgi:undecaprenyl-diphosphatase